MRALAKRAGDRFDTARDMRKALEQVLKDHDLGLVETQKLSREGLGDERPEPATQSLRATPRPTPAQPKEPSRRLATASELADELEPGGTPGRRRRRWRWAILAIGAVVAAGGAAGALVLLPGSAGYQPAVKIEGATLTAGQRFGALLIETDGQVSPAEIEAIYRTQLAALRLHITQHKPGLEIADPVAQIVALPRAAMCEKRNWLVDPPGYCATSPSVTLFGPQNEHRMFVVSERAQLVEALRRGVAQAACDLHQTADPVRNRQVCELTEQFIQAGAR